MAMLVRRVISIANFDRWEKDPFFSAAEEVQESADRMESMYRRWLNSTKSTSGELSPEDFRRNLSTALDTAKWQLEEFERAVQSSYNSNADEAKLRHSQFILALEGKVSMIQNSLLESAASNEKSFSPLIQLNEGECDELALFISGPEASSSSSSDRTETTYSLKCSSPPSLQEKDGSADITSWNITIPENELDSQSSNGHIEALPRRVPSFSAFGTVESVPIPKSIFWKDDDVVFLRSQMQNRGANPYYERNKSSIENCDDCYDKQLYGWYGSLHRLVQRGLYQVQYVRFMQITFGATLLVCMMVLCLVCIF